MKTSHLIILIAVLYLFFSKNKIKAQTSVPYTYKDVRIGAGGYVTGIIYSMAEQDLIYARTDVGGAYRWNSANRTWIPLTDFLDADNENQSGILSIAADPSDANRVYLATGEYTASWAGNGAVFASDDKGNTWTRTNLSIKLGGNEDGRSAGERLQVDPNKGNILFLGSSADGLWKSTDYGATWNKVTSFPVSTSTQGSGGISFVLFDKTSSTSGNATQTIYVGVMRTGSSNFFKSIDGGATWTTIAGATTSYMPFRAVLASDKNMYMTYCDNPGPSGISAGAVYKYNTSTGTWKTITPPSGQGAWGGISVDAQNSSVIMVGTLDRWSPKDEIYRSVNGGTTWKAVLSTATLDNTSAPYVSSYYPHWIGDVQIDPFNSNNAWFITGYGTYGTINATAPDNGGKIKFSFDNKGLEELVVLGLVSPPGGVPLLSAVGDQDGFRHTDLDTSPAAGKYLPGYGGSSSLDFAQFNPDFVVRTYFNSGGNWGSYSTDQGKTWIKFPKFPSGTSSAGVVAIAADASRLIWSSGGVGAYYSVNKGSSWIASTGINPGVNVVADRVNPKKFYGYDATAGVVKISTNSGVSFTSGASLPTLPGYNQWMSSIAAVFGLEGNIWVTSGYNGLYFSTNSGANFIKITAVQVAYKVVFGKSMTDGGYPAVYITGKINNQYGYYRSVDSGATWVRVNDDQHQYFSARAFAADPNVFGRIYIGSSGRGILYGSPASTECDTATTSTAASITQNIQVNNTTPQQTSGASVLTNDKVILSPVSSSANGSWYWTGPALYHASTREITLTGITTTLSGTYHVTYTNYCGIRSESVFTITVDGVTATINETSKKHVFIYPNPARGRFTIECPDLKEIYIINVYNMHGILIYTKQSASVKTDIDISLQVGIYNVSVSNGKTQFIEKLVIE